MGARGRQRASVRAWVGLHRFTLWKSGVICWGSFQLRGISIMNSGENVG